MYAAFLNAYLVFSTEKEKENLIVFLLLKIWSIDEQYMYICMYICRPVMGMETLYIII